jgi:hypothetical protein
MKIFFLNVLLACVWVASAAAQKQSVMIAEGAAKKVPETGENLVFGAPIEEWIIATNMTSPQVRLTRIQVVEDFFEGEVLRVEYPFRPHPADFGGYRLKIRDEHGCEAEGRFTLGTGSSHGAQWSVYPRAAPQFRLLIEKDTDTGTKTVADYTVKNLHVLPRIGLKAEALPVRRDLDLVTAVFRGIESFPEFDFEREGKPVEGWIGIITRYVDGQGNQSLLMKEGFCRKEGVFKVQAKFSRMPQAEFLPEEEVTVLIRGIPEAGKFHAINKRLQVQGLEFEVLAVTGTGEFTYHENEIVSATAEIDKNAEQEMRKQGLFAATLIVNGRPEEKPAPNIYVKGGRPDFIFHQSNSGRERITFVSKVPHVSVRVRKEPAHWENQDTTVHLKEQGSREIRYHWEPFVPKQGIETFAINPALIRDNRLTIVVQKARTAEFVVSKR